MDDYLASSRAHIALADHLLHTSFPLLQDPKLLKVALQALFVAASRSANTLVGNLDKPFEQKLEAFKQAVVQHELSPVYVDLLSDLGAYAQRIKTTSTMFSRHQKLILLQEETYELTLEQVKEFSFRTKSLVTDLLHTNE